MTQIKKVGEAIKVCIFMDYNMYLIQCCKYRILKICVEPDNPSLLLASHTKGQFVVVVWTRLLKRRPSLTASFAK